MSLPERHFRTQAICGYTKEQLLKNLRNALLEYRLRTSIETTTYLHHSGYHGDWWTIIFDVLLKNVHIHGTPFYGSILNAYKNYLNMKQNNISLGSDRSIGWHMALVATYVCVSEKTKQFSYNRKNHPFYDFIMTEGSERPTKLKIIHKQIESCMEECITEVSFNDALDQLHCLMREDYGHNKYVPQLMTKIIASAQFKQSYSMRALEALYDVVPGHRRYLCPVIMLNFLYNNYHDADDFSRFEQQADYYYNKTIRKITNYYEERENEKNRSRVPTHVSSHVPTRVSSHVPTHTPQEVQDPHSVAHVSQVPPPRVDHEPVSVPDVSQVPPPRVDHEQDMEEETVFLLPEEMDFIDESTSDVIPESYKPDVIEESTSVNNNANLVRRRNKIKIRML